MQQPVQRRMQRENAADLGSFRGVSRANATCADETIVQRGKEGSWRGFISRKNPFF